MLLFVSPLPHFHETSFDPICSQLASLTQMCSPWKQVSIKPIRRRLLRHKRIQPAVRDGLDLLLLPRFLALHWCCLPLYMRWHHTRTRRLRAEAAQPSNFTTRMMPAPIRLLKVSQKSPHKFQPKPQGMDSWTVSRGIIEPFSGSEMCLSTQNIQHKRHWNWSMNLAWNWKKMILFWPHFWIVK